MGSRFTKSNSTAATSSMTTRFLHQVVKFSLSIRILKDTRFRRKPPHPSASPRPKRNPSHSSTQAFLLPKRLSSKQNWTTRTADVFMKSNSTAATPSTIMRFLLPTAKSSLTIRTLRITKFRGKTLRPRPISARPKQNPSP